MFHSPQEIHFGALCRFRFTVIVNYNTKSDVKQFLTFFFKEAGRSSPLATMLLIIKDFLQILALQESLVGVKKLVEQKPREWPRALVVLSTTTIDAPQTASHKNLIPIESYRYELSTTVIWHSVLPGCRPLWYKQAPAKGRPWRVRKIPLLGIKRVR